MDSAKGMTSDPSSPGWSQSLQLSGVTFTNGEHCVYLFNPGTGAVTTLTLGEPPHNGLKLEGLENTDDPTRCSVIVSLNGERAVIRPIDYATEAAPLPTFAANAVTDDSEIEQSEEKPAAIRAWNGPRFDLEAAKAAAAARQAQGD